MKTTTKYGMTALVAIAVLAFTPWSNAKDNSDPDVVSEVDFDRYSGLWYEIAHDSNFFQRGCKRSTAEYAVLDETRVSVLNTCYKHDGTFRDIKGVATVVDPATPAKLKVRFNIFSRGDYWITHLDQNYQWAVVSGPAKKSLFILARQAPMDKGLLDAILAQLNQEGYDLSDLIYDDYR